MKTNKVVLDTSFISGLVFEDDLHYETAHEIFSSLESNINYYIPIIVEAELLMLKSKIPYKSLLNLIDLFEKELDVEIIYIDKIFQKKFRSFIEESKFKVKATDAVILFTTISLNARLLTFDERLFNLWEKLS